METMLIFTDAATSPQMSIAIGAYLILNRDNLPQYAECSIAELLDQLADQIIYQHYQSKKSTASEMTTVIDALRYAQQHFSSVKKIEIYTDCQSLCDLLGRRKEKLLKNNFITRAGKVLQNAELYRQLYLLAEQFDIQVIKIKGHDTASNRVSVEARIFDVLDKLSRKKLRFMVNR